MTAGKKASNLVNCLQLLSTTINMRLVSIRVQAACYCTDLFGKLFLVDYEPAYIGQTSVTSENQAATTKEIDATANNMVGVVRQLSELAKVNTVDEVLQGNK
jgi:hypothetical protein